MGGRGASLRGTSPTGYITDRQGDDFRDAAMALARRKLDAKSGKEEVEILLEGYKPFQKGVADETNFFFNTAAHFEPVDGRPRRKPDFVSLNRDGKVSSEYWYTKDGVIRGSNHWGSGVASVDWTLGGLKSQPYEVRVVGKMYGKALWGDFVHKTNLMTAPNGKRFLSSFNNTTGRNEYTIGGKSYRYNSDYRLAPADKWVRI